MMKRNHVDHSVLEAELKLLLKTNTLEIQASDN